MSWIKSNIDVRIFSQTKDLSPISLTQGMALSTSQAMIIAIQEAYQGAARVSPNPLVGCVVLDSNGNFLSKGYHEFYGGNHAEVNAVASLSSKDLEGAHVIVTLEPCAHEGKTPSCAKMLAKLPIAKVTYGLKDPNPLVSGQGAAILMEAGKKVAIYNEADFNLDLTLELEELAENFLFNFREKKVFVALKWAQSLDGKMALTNGHSQWITNFKSREYAHYLRAIYDATLVGANTIAFDNPQLNIRLEGINKKNKIVIFDHQGRIYKNKSSCRFSQIHESENICFIIDKEYQEKIKEENSKVLFIEKTDHHYDLAQLNQKLYEWGIRSLLVEGGAKTLQYFLEQKQWQRIYAFVAPMILGQGLSYSSEININSMTEKLLLHHSKSMNLQNDILITGKRELI